MASVGVPFWPVPPIRFPVQATNVDRGRRLTKIPLRNLELLRLVRLPPRGGMGADWITETFEDNFA